MKRLLAMAAFLMTFSNPCMANLLTNGSFETASPGSSAPAAGTSGELLAVGSTAMLGWTVNGGNEIAWLPAGNPYGVTPENGTEFLDLTGYYDTPPYGGVTQTANLAAGNYALTFYLGEDESTGVYSGPVSVSVSAGDQSNVVFTNALTGTGNIWLEETLNFSSAGGSTAISIIGKSSGGGQYIGLDNVDLESVATPPNSPVPEPPMALPAVLAFVGLLFLRLRNSPARGSGRVPTL